MTYGLSVSNSSGGAVIEDGYRNHVVIASGTVTLSMTPVLTINGFVTVATFTLPAPVSRSLGPLLWARCLSAQAALALLTTILDVSGNVTGYVIGYGLWDYAPALPGSITVDWRVTALASGASSDTHGLRVFNSDASVAFDSGFDYLKIVHSSGPFDIRGVGNIASPYFAYSRRWTHAAISDPYFCLSGLNARRCESPSGDDSLEMALGAVRESSTTSLTVFAWWRSEAGQIMVYDHPPGVRNLLIATP